MIELNQSLFPLGRLVITANAQHVLDPDDVPAALRRHAAGDWGGLCAEDKAENQRALTESGRLFSKYHDRHGVALYVITEADRSVTTVLLPQDY